MFFTPLMLLGKPFRRYAAWTTPEEMQTDIEYLLGDADAPISKGNSRKSSKVLY